MDIRYFIKLKSSTANKTFSRVKRQSTEGDGIFSNYISWRGFITWKYKKTQAIQPHKRFNSLRQRQSIWPVFKGRCINYNKHMKKMCNITNYQWYTNRKPQWNTTSLLLDWLLQKRQKEDASKDTDKRQWNTVDKNVN